MGKIMYMDEEYAADANVSILNKISSGVNIADVTIDGNTTHLYAPEGGAKNIWYGTCSTAAGTQAKVITTTSGDFELVEGNMLRVYFVNGNSFTTSGSLITFAVDGNTPVNAARFHGATTSDYFGSGVCYDYTYTGGEFLQEGIVRATSNQYGVTLLNTSISSTNTNEAATPSAVKQAYDLASSANNKAMWYGTCATAAGTAAKTSTITGITSLYTGLTICIKFTNSNTASQPTLNLNSLGAKYITRYGTTSAGQATSSSWQAGSVITMTYDGTYWQMHDWNNTTYSSKTAASGGTDVSLVTTGEKYIWNNRAQLTSTSVSLGTTGWTTSGSKVTKSVTVTGVTASNNVIVSPAPSYVNDYANSGIICTAQTSNSLTFTADSTPTVNITVNILIVT